MLPLSPGALSSSFQRFQCLRVEDRLLTSPSDTPGSTQTPADDEEEEEEEEGEEEDLKKARFSAQLGFTSAHI